jgi:hypothetical protein
MPNKEYPTETYASILRKYADGVEQGTFDQDLDALTRVYVTRLVHAASTAEWAGVVYPPSDSTRDSVSADVHRAYMNGSIGVPLDAEPSYHAAIVRAVEIVRGV